MDVSKLKRDPKFIKSKISNKKGVITALADMEIHALESLRNDDLVNLGENKEVLGTFAIVCEGRYAVWAAPTMYSIDPYKVDVIEIDGSKILVFSFNKGDTLIKNLRTVKTAGFVFLIMKLYIFQGKLPWFFGVGDVTNFFSKCGKYAGLTIDETPELLSVLEALMTRLDTDDDVLLKNSNVPMKDWGKRRKYIPLDNASYIKSTMGKVVGNYQEVGMRSAMITDPSEAGLLEKVMRS